MKAKIKNKKEKTKILKELKEIKNKISEKDSEIDKLEISLMQKIDKTFSEERKITASISKLQEENNWLKTKNKNSLKKYNEYLQNKNHLTKEYKIELSALKKKYQKKLKERDKLMKEVKKEYDIQMNKLETVRKQLILGQKKGWSIWKRLGLKEKYDAENKKKEEKIEEAIVKIKEDFKVLLNEKEMLDKEYKEKKENIGEVLLTKKSMQKKDIFDKVKKNKKNIMDLESKNENNEKTIEKLKSSLEKLEKEKETLQQKLGDKEKFLDLSLPVYKLKLTKKTKRLKITKPEVEPKKEGIRPIIVLGPTKTDFSKVYEDLEKEEPEIKEEDIEQEENLLQLGKKPGAVRRCERLIENGNRALEEGNLKKATKILEKLENKYSKLPNIQKLAVSNEFGLFKEKLNQKCQLEMEEEEIFSIIFSIF